MNRTLTLQNVGIAIATKNHNPSVLTPDFLKYSGIVPDDWELAQQPVVSKQASQVVFNNALSIVAQPQLLNFLEVVINKEITDIQAPGITHSYIKALPNVEYQAIGVNLKGYILESQLGSNQTVQDYMNSLLAPAAWQEVGNAPVLPTIQLAFTLDRCEFSLGITEGKLYVTEQETVPIVLFTGNFSYAVTGNSKEEKLQSLHKLIDNWQTDLKDYVEIINTKFLQPEIFIQNAPERITTEILVPQL
ncbi:hypothetical protein NIES2100_12420 [Calothrix sp. NIES-2100]|uniref:hypothetical protein n=1 Tax=Calothrix sp. NIES-2100 TaxID=1954172 RepID=UPI000B5EA5FE|nr:hypothetical protein NIES2100_12420 [Calothrix sp. NIES-2100]